MLSSVLTITRQGLMKKPFIFDSTIRKASLWALICLLAILMTAEFAGHALMTSGFSVSVSNVWIENQNGLEVRGKLFKPADVSQENPAPGVVYLHGYQNNRETSDPYGIELSRRGFVVILLDTLGRGNSDNQFSETEPGFDPTYGAETAFTYLQNLPYVDANRCGLGGHSLGGEMSYIAALSNPKVRAIVFSGFAYREDATTNSPANMLMIFGKFDEYRDRMTGTRDFEAEWPASPATLAAFGVENVQFDTTYGSFTDGTARRNHMTRTTHVNESFDRTAIAEAVTWFSQALNPGQSFSIPAESQIWRWKELASLAAMVSGILTTIPAGILLLGTRPFADLAEGVSSCYSRDKKTFRRSFWINAGLTLLYLALIMVIFGLHVYVVPIDRAFPMMMVNGVVFWFLIINLIGFLLFKAWVNNRNSTHPEVNYKELGLSEEEHRIKLNWGKVGKSFLLAGLLFGFVYLLQAGLEALFLIDFRYKFPYASDLTPYRWLMMLLYFPFFLAGFLQMNILLQGQLRPKLSKTWWGSALNRSLSGIFVITDRKSVV